MKRRQLSVAFDEEGKRVPIDSVERERKYLCPYCTREVIPKMGEKKVWHFAHKGEVCEYLNIKTKDGLRDAQLDLQSIPTKSVSDIDIGEGCARFMCLKCRKAFRKEGGVKWERNEYVCKECFKLM